MDTKITITIWPTGDENLDALDAVLTTVRSRFYNAKIKVEVK